MFKFNVVQGLVCPCQDRYDFYWCMGTIWLDALPAATSENISVPVGVEPTFDGCKSVASLTPFRHIARMDNNVDAKQILTSSPSVYWKRPPGRPWMTWMKMVQNDLDSHGLSWTDTVDLAQN